MRPRSGATPVRWKLLLPESWIVQPGTESPEVASFEADNLRAAAAPDEDEEDELVGKLSFAIVARGAVKRPRELASVYLDALAESGLTLAHRDFSADPCGPPFSRAFQLVSPVTRKDAAPGEVRCRVLVHPRAWVIAGVLSPRREDDPAAWTQNQRALDVVTSTLRIKE